MRNIPLERGHTANIDSGTIAGDLRLNGTGAGYSVAIGAMRAMRGIAAAGESVVFHINHQKVRVTNTTPPPGPVNLHLMY